MAAAGEGREPGHGGHARGAAASGRPSALSNLEPYPAPFTGQGFGMLPLLKLLKRWMVVKPVDG